MDESRERTLWLAVILTAVEDLRGGKSAEMWESARAWVFDTAQEMDFEAVCALAGVEADSIRERCRKLLPASAVAA